MPKLVKEIASGGSNDRSVDGGTLSDVSVRNWRIILDSPSEAYDIQNAIGVRIGDLHPVNTSLPCVSFSEKAEGDSRVVRIVTATYRTTAGADPGNDPNKQPPDIRPARYSISSSLIEVPATQWRKIGNLWQPENPNNPFGNGQWVEAAGAPEDAVNPAGDRFDGVSKLVPLITITIEQYDNFPTRRLDDAGKVNNDNFQFLGLPIGKYSCMLRGISTRPHVEAHGAAIYRGFMRTFEFTIKTNGGWIIEQILEGFNIINQNLNGADVENEALMLEHDLGKVKQPLALAANFPAGKKCRAAIPIHFPDGGWCQRPSSAPVALNEDGTPRSRNANPPVLRRKYLTQGDAAFGNNFVNLGVRIFDIV